MAAQSEKTLNIIRGKTIAGHVTPNDVLKLLAHIDELEIFLDAYNDNDTFGTEGWRHRLGLE
jgi:hypothetical protein